MSAAPSRFTRWSAELRDRSHEIDTLARQLDRIAGICRCLPGDSGLRDALVGDLGTIANNTRGERDKLARLGAQLERAAQVGCTLRVLRSPLAPVTLRRSC